VLMAVVPRPSFSLALNIACLLDCLWRRGQFVPLVGDLEHQNGKAGKGGEQGLSCVSACQGRARWSGAANVSRRSPV
jgi:hypothetical protein